MKGTFLVTGVSGFIGWHLADHLIKQGANVIGIDKRRDKSIELLEDSGRLLFKLCDLTVKEDLTTAFSKEVSVVYHLAGQPFVWFANANPREDCLINVLGTIHLLERMRELGCRRIIFSSTGDVYQNTHMAGESSPADPANFYGLSKLVAENYIRLYQKMFFVDYTILRLAVVYGPGLRRNIIYDITEALAAGKKLVLPVASDSQYDIVYIDDVVTALISASSNGWVNKTVNISTGIGITASEILALAGKYTGMATSGITFTKDNVVRKVYHNILASNLGWRPEYQPEEGLKRVIAHRPTDNTAKEHGS